MIPPEGMDAANKAAGPGLDNPDPSELAKGAELVNESRAMLALLGPLKLGKAMTDLKTMTNPDAMKLLQAEVAAISLGIIYARKLEKEAEDAAAAREQARRDASRN